MLKRNLLVMGLVGAITSGAMAEVIVSYSSDVDVDLGTPGVIDLDPGMSATITVDLTATDNEDGLGSAGFVFAGTPGAGTVENAGIVMSNFAWNAGMTNAATWLTNSDLPNPAGAAFFAGVALDFPVDGFATWTITAPATDTEIFLDWETGPLNFTNRDVAPLTLGDGAGSYAIHVTPEPATLVLLAMGGVALLRRR